MHRLCVFILVSIFFFLAIPHSFAATVSESATQPAVSGIAQDENNAIKSDGPVELKGDKVEYNNMENKFEAQGNVVVTRGDTKIYADQLQFYRLEKVGIAEGNVFVEIPKGTITGDKMTYSLDKQTGNFTNARIFSAPYYGKGTVISKIGPNKMNMQGGYLTTCDHDTPHFRLQAKSIDIEPGKQARARNVKMFVGPVPLMYLPRYTQDLTNRRPIYSLTPGYSKDFGYFVLQAWRYEFNEKVNGTFHADFRDRKGSAVGGDFDYKTKNFGEGSIRTYYMNEYNIGEYHLWEEREIKAIYRERFKGEWRHKWNVDDKTTATWQYYKLSDADFLKDYFKRENRKDPNPRTYLTVTRALPLGTLGLVVQNRVNKFNAEVERLPELNYNLSNQAIGSTGLYLKNNSSYVNLTKKEAYPSLVNLETKRLDTQNEISYPMKVAFVEVKPFVGGESTYYSRTTNPENYNSVRGQFKTGADLSTKFSRVFDVNTKFLGVEVNRLRHIITPSVAYLYAHDPTIESAKLDQFDSIDSLSRSHKVLLSLENKLQTKRDGKPVDLARLVLESPFLLKEDPGKGGFNTVTSKLELNPSDWLKFSSDTTYDPKAEHLTGANFDMYISNKDRGWYFNLGQRYSRDVDNQITTEWGYKINSLWRFKIYQRFAIDSGILKEEQYSFVRDLHEWEMETSFNQTRGNGNQIMVIFRLKAFPDLVIDAGTSFNKRKAGSQSGE